MPDRLSPSQRHNCMSRIRSANTKPEVKVRKALFHSGYRYRINVRTLPGTPDIVLPKYRTAVFINGCFWHGHEGCKYYTVPKTNVDFWVAKVRNNKERDLIDNRRLDSLAWCVITIWECELKGEKFDATISKLISDLQANKIKWEQYQQRRRSDREFARAESSRKKQVLAELEQEIQAHFHIPAKVVKASLEDPDL